MTPITAREWFYERDGRLYWRKAKGAASAHSVVRSGNQKGYLRVMLDGRKYCVHRIVWMLHYGDIPAGMEVDHKDLNNANNRPGNLQLITGTANSLKKGTPVNNTTGCKGVYADRNKWAVIVTYRKKRYRGGAFVSKVDAATAANILRERLRAADPEYPR